MSDPRLHPGWCLVCDLWRYWCKHVTAEDLRRPTVADDQMGCLPSTGLRCGKCHRCTPPDPSPAPTPSETEALADRIGRVLPWLASWARRDVARVILAAGYVSAEEVERREAAAARKAMLDAADQAHLLGLEPSSGKRVVTWLRDRAEGGQS